MWWSLKRAQRSGRLSSNRSLPPALQQPFAGPSSIQSPQLVHHLNIACSNPTISFKISYHLHGYDSNGEFTLAKTPPTHSKRGSSAKLSRPSDCRIVPDALISNCGKSDRRRRCALVPPIGTPTCAVTSPHRVHLLRLLESSLCSLSATPRLRLLISSSAANVLCPQNTCHSNLVVW